MARYVKDVVLNKPDDFVIFIMNDFLQKNQFAMADWHGEPAYRAGDAMMEGYKFLKWSYQGGVFHLEAWLRGTAGGEWDLDGVVGVVQKKPYKESLEQLLQVLQQPLPEGESPQGAQGVQPDMAQGQQEGAASQGEPVQRTVPVHTVDNTGAANRAFLFGILSIIGGLLIPLLGLILACVGFSSARMGMGSSLADKAKKGKVLCIVGMAVSIGLWLLNIILNVALL